MISVGERRMTKLSITPLKSVGVTDDEIDVALSKVYAILIRAGRQARQQRAERDQNASTTRLQAGSKPT
jgi:hypothetical protein